MVVVMREKRRPAAMREKANVAESAAARDLPLREGRQVGLAIVAMAEGPSTSTRWHWI